MVNPSGTDDTAAARISDKINERLGIELLVENPEDGFAWPAKSIVIGDPKVHSSVADTLREHGLDPSTDIPTGHEQSYALLITSDLILIASPYPAGRFYGAISIRRMLAEADLSEGLAASLVVDWPDLALRGLYGAGKSFIPELGEIVDTSDVGISSLTISLITKSTYGLVLYPLYTRHSWKMVVSGHLAPPQFSGDKIEKPS